MRIFYWLAELLFPRKCILCRGILDHDELDLCRTCRAEQPVFPYSRENPEPTAIYQPHFLDSLTAVWYYEDAARIAIHRYKFSRRTALSKPFGRILGMKLVQGDWSDAELLTWVPVSPLRRFRRGFDQSELIAKRIGQELNRDPVQLLKKIHHNPAQSGIHGLAARKANVLGAYRVTAPELVRGRVILLVDDVHTTGATTEECAKMLKLAGAKEVHCAVIAAAHRRKL